MRFLFFILLFTCTSIQALEYGLSAKCEGGKPITHVKVYSERCSGSNYVIQLILTNFEKIKWERFCHKHFPPWLDYPNLPYLGDSRHHTFKKTGHVLFIVVFRNPYDWVRSLHRQQHHTPQTTQALPFGEFIRIPWELDPNIAEVVELQQLNPLMDRNPATGALFENPMQLRTAKIKTMLEINNRAKNVYYVNYETVRDHPREVLREIQNIFWLKLTLAYQPVIHYKNDKQQGIYKANNYAPLSEIDLDYINTHLDPELERRIGYALTSNPDELK